MYINFSMAAAKGIVPTTLVAMIAAAQNKVEDNQSYITDYIGEVTDDAFFKLQKNGKVVLSSAGRKLYEEIQIPDVTDNDIILYDWLVAEVGAREWVIGSKKKIVGLITWFRVEANIDIPQLHSLLEDYLASADSEYNKKLEYLFFKPSNMYSKRKLEESRLYEWFENNKN